MSVKPPKAEVARRWWHFRFVPIGDIGSPQVISALVADHAAGEAGQDGSQGRQPWPLCHVPIGRSCRAEGAIPENLGLRRWAAAGPFAAMTAVHPVTARAPDRTGVCCAGRSAPSQCEMVTGTGFSSPNQPDQEGTTANRASSGPESWPDAQCATIIRDCEESYGESRLRQNAY